MKLPDEVVERVDLAIESFQIEQVPALLELLAERFDHEPGTPCDCPDGCWPGVAKDLRATAKSIRQRIG